MTVTTENNRITYEYVEGINQLTFDFPVLDESHLLVYEGEELTLAPFSVYGVGDEAGGYIEFNGMNKPAAGSTIVIYRSVPYTQEMDYLAYDPFPAESHENAIDKLTMLLQQHTEELGRAIKAPIDTPESVTIEIPSYVPGGVWMWDESGNLVATTLLEDYVAQEGARFRQQFSATLGQQVFTCGFKIANESVYYNGVLVPANAYTISTVVSDDDTITLDVGAEYLGDIIEIESFTTVVSLELADFVPTTGGSMTGTLGMAGNVPIVFGTGGTGQGGINVDTYIFSLTSYGTIPMHLGQDSVPLIKLNNDQTISLMLDDADNPGTWVDVKLIEVDPTNTQINIEVGGVAAYINYTNV